MPRKSSTHIHQLKRGVYKTSGEKFFYCTGETCDYKISVELALGKQTLCWRCGQPFKLNQYSLRLARPHCSNCHGSKNEIPVSEHRYTHNRRREEDSLILPAIRENSLSTLKDRLDNPRPIQIDEMDVDLLD